VLIKHKPQGYSVCYTSVLAREYKHALVARRKAGFPTGR